ncbi:MAG: tetratricopeptide repeat protein [Bacteroidales bacterium]|nr:tetratricopeptide repeat protein [Bacteroidales bacterium]
MTKNNNVQEPEINVGEALSKTEKFFETYKKPMLYTIAAIVIVGAIALAYYQFIHLPKQQEAMGQTFAAEAAFRANDFEKALNGDGNTMGFKQVIDEYGAKAGEAVYFYAGVCELHLGNFAEAIKYFDQYKGSDPIMAARAIGCKGDAYSSMNELEKAAAEYVKAAKSADNLLAAGYLKKAGIVYEELGKSAEALKMYEEIKTKYPKSPEGFEINKYISRIQATK